MKKLICPACGNSGASDAIYCSKCGTELNPGSHAYFCIRCGQTLDDNANYCAYCREPVPCSSTGISVDYRHTAWYSKITKETECLIIEKTGCL